MLTADRTLGEVRRADGSLLCRFESGYDPDVSTKGEPGEGVNNPALEAIRNVGPLPAGFYVMGPPFNHPTAGGYTMRLQFVPGTGDLHGRSGFLWHGGWRDPKAHKDNASHGCMVSSFTDRVRAWEEGDHLIRVI